MQRVFKGILGNIAYFLSGFFPRDKGCWLFGAWEGVRYSDNARYFFEYVIKNANGFPQKAYWLTHNPKVEQLLKAQGYPVLLASSWKAWWYNLRAGLIFVTHGKDDVIHFLSRGAVVIHLNHALPIKHMGYDVKNDPYHYPASFLRKWFFKIVAPHWCVKYDYSVSPSQKTAWIVKSSLKMTEDQILSFGFPRFAPLLSPAQETDRRRLSRELGGASESRWVLYMPTFRDARGFSHFDYGFDIERMEKVLAEHNATLLLTLHPFDSSGIPARIKDSRSPSIRWIAPMDANELLPHIDVLITDYSSVMFDYLLLDRPIIYTRFDFEEFVAKQRGLYFDYAEVAAGCTARTWAQVEEHLSKILAGGKDVYALERDKVRKMVFDDNPGQANERIMRYCAGLAGR